MQVLLEELKAMEQKGPAFEEALLRDISWYYLTQSVFKVVLQKTIPTHVRELVFILVMIENKFTD